MKNFKKIVALLLCVVFVVAMVSVSVAEPAEETGEKNYSNITIIMANYSQPTSIYGQRVQDFADYLEEHSGGKITCQIFFNEEFCGGREELDYLRDGALDIVCSSIGPIGKVIPFFGIDFDGDGYEESVELEYKLMVENEESAAIIQNACEAKGFHILPAFGVGESWYPSKTEIKSWDDFTKANFGAERVINVYDKLGLHSQQMAMSDIYESLSRGVIDATGTALPNLMSNRFYDVCPYLLTGVGGTINCAMCINLDFWNSLTEDDQALIIEANDYSVETATENSKALKEESLKTFEEAGCTVNVFSQEDVDLYNSLNGQCNYDSFYELAEQEGLVDEFNRFVEIWSEYTGTEIEFK